MIWNCLLALLLIIMFVRAEGAGQFSGFIAADVRIFPESPAWPGQMENILSPSLLLQPEYRYKWHENKDLLTIVPFARLEFDDQERRHFDVQELNWWHDGSSWDVLFGVSKVFWGVTESRHLVDIINQTDLVEDPDEEVKLGQPMLRLSLLRDWGTLTVFALPYFRERTFPGRRGRLRAALPVDTDRRVYESSSEEWHPDFAVRWAHALGAWDLGVAHFWGTSREPRFVPDHDNAGRLFLIPHYDLIHQSSLDLQVTKGSWLWKLEAMTRSGHGDRFTALVAGFEYTLFGIFETAIDVGILGEYLYDGRGDEAPPTPFKNDVFVGTRLAFNDPQSTELLAGATIDSEMQATFVNIEASRRLGNRWTIELEVRAFLNIPTSDILFNVRRDDYMQIRVVRYF